MLTADQYLSDLLSRARQGQTLTHNQLLDITHHSDVNLVSFDIETTGLQSHLEAPSATTGIFTEFGIATKQREIHGFTNYASIKSYAETWEKANKPVGSLFKSALNRFINYEGQRYSATDVLHAIGSTFEPNKANVILGHNIAAFDWKFLTAHHALEQGFISEGAVEGFKRYASAHSGSDLTDYFLSNIKPGWEKAQESAWGILQQYDPHVSMLDTLGELDPTGKFKSSKFPRPQNLAGPRGMIGTFVQEKFPGLHSFYKQHFVNQGMEESGAREAAFYAARKGSTLEDWMKFAGTEFAGEAHHP